VKNNIAVRLTASERSAARRPNPKLTNLLNMGFNKLLASPKLYLG